MKKITLYAQYWNDIFYLPFVKKHYEKFCQRIVLMDNHSTDGGADLARSWGWEVRTFGYKDRLDDSDYLTWKDHAWKEERENGQFADYVIVCDIDEFVFPDDLRGTAPVVHGYNMISESLPVNDIMEINTGAPSVSYSKQAIFNPMEIKEIAYVHGCHLNHMSGNITREGSCRLLHFRMIGGVERIIHRHHQQYRPRMSAFNLQHGMGIHYCHTDDQKRIEWNALKAEAKQLW